MWVRRRVNVRENVCVCERERERERGREGGKGEKCVGEKEDEKVREGGSWMRAGLRCALVIRRYSRSIAAVALLKRVYIYASV